MNPDKVQARKMVLIGVSLLAAIAVYRQNAGKSGVEGTYRALWGVGVVGLFLSLLADFVPQIAGPFAALIVLGSLTHGGEKALENVLGTLSPQPSGSSSSAPQSPGRGPGSTSSTPPANAGPNPPAQNVPAPSTHPVQ